jgi:hypothetical protein
MWGECEGGGNIYEFIKDNYVWEDDCEFELKWSKGKYGMKDEYDNLTIPVDYKARRNDEYLNFINIHWVS